MQSRVSLRSLFITSCLVVIAVGLAAGAAGVAAAEAQGDKGKTHEGLVIDINEASAQELTRLPGIGPVMAERIVQFREQNGGFRRVEDLLKIKGIGEKSFQKLRPSIKVSKGK